MQSEGNSFDGDVVSNSFNIAYRDKPSIFYQKYEKKQLWNLYYEDFKFKNDGGKSIIKKNTAQNNKKLILLGLVQLLCKYF